MFVQLSNFLFKSNRGGLVFKYIAMAASQVNLCFTKYDKNLIKFIGKIKKTKVS